MKFECAKIVLALSAIIIVTYAVTIICLPRKGHHKLLSTDESKVTLYVDAMSWSDITPSLCLHIQKLELTIDKNKLPKLFRTFVLLTLILANDIHLNPGPIQYPCGICGRSVNSNHRAISCDNCEHWVHIKCSNISPVEYNNMCKV
jgi:DNA-directed RNA polymerase subunit RPC12/RpoP